MYVDNLELISQHVKFYDYRPIGYT